MKKRVLFVLNYGKSLRVMDVPMEHASRLESQSDKDWAAWWYLNLVDITSCLEFCLVLEDVRITVCRDSAIPNHRYGYRYRSTLDITEAFDHFIRNQTQMLSLEDAKVDMDLRTGVVTDDAHPGYFTTKTVIVRSPRA